MTGAVGLRIDERVSGLLKPSCCRHSALFYIGLRFRAATAVCDRVRRRKSGKARRQGAPCRTPLSTFSNPL